ncbi:MAG: hypothetical protein R8M14_05405 [Ghiorsea sp.]
MSNNPDEVRQAEALASLKTITTVVYALQALSFFTGLTFIAAVVINYIKKEDVQGTWLESHFLWQIRTFWYGFLWGIIGLATFFIAIGYFVLIANSIWLVYRIIKGWLRLTEGKSMYPDSQPTEAI